MSTETMGTVLFVNQYAVPGSASGGTRHYDFAKTLSSLNWNVEIIASDLNLTTRRYSRRSGRREFRTITRDEDGVVFRYLYASAYQANDWRRAASMVSFGLATFVHLSVRRLPKRTIFVGSSPHLFAAFGTFLAAKVRHRSFIFEVRDLWPESYVAVSGKSTKSPEVRLMRWIADTLYRKCDAIVVLAAPNVAQISFEGKADQRISYIPNGVDPKSFPSIDREDRNDADTIFVYAGAHGPANGLDIVVEAVKLLEQMGESSIKVLMVGDGPAKSELVDRARNESISSITFLDPVPKSEVPRLFSKSDVGLMVLADVELFRHGVSPNKLFDYLASDLPIVTNVPGLVAEIVTDAKAGIVCEPGSAVSLANAMVTMRQILAGEDEAFSGGRQYVEREFNRVRLAEGLSNLLVEVLDS